MEGLIPYIIKSSSILFILYGYYWLFLRKQTFFTINRFYLLISLFWGMTLPFVSIEVTGPMLTTAGKFHPVAYIESFSPDEVKHERKRYRRAVHLATTVLGFFIPGVYGRGIVFLYPVSDRPFSNNITGPPQPADLH